MSELKPTPLSVAWSVDQRGVSLRLPAGFADQTVLTFVDNAERPQVSVTVSHDALSGGRPGLLRYVTEQLEAIKRAAPLFHVATQAEHKHPVGAAIQVEATVGSRVQHQLYLLDEKGARVIVATATASSDAAERARQVFDSVAGSLAVEVTS